MPPEPPASPHPTAHPETPNAAIRPGRPRVLVVGGGFAGLACVRALKHADADVVLLDRRNHHLFQPLLYQVATAALSPADIASPIRRILRRQKNCTVIMGEALAVDPDRKILRAGSSDRPDAETRDVPYDTLVLACGMTHNYFGNDDWQAHAPGLKSIEDATEIRRRVLMSFEAAERADDPDARRAELTFVIVGGGPTGVELAGAIAEIAAESIPRDFRRVNTRTAQVILVEGESRLLRTYPEPLSARAKRDLEALGVEIVLGQHVSTIDETGATVGQGDTARRIDSRCVIWAAGLKAEPIAKTLNAETDHAGRVKVNPDLSVPGHPDVFVVGDQMACTDPNTGNPVPGVAQGAIQSGRYVGRHIARTLAGKATKPDPFRYHNKGEMATIGRGRAVADLNGLHLTGFIAWAAWSVVHVFALIDFRQRLLAMLEWAWLYLTWTRGARLITGPTRDRKPS